MSDEQQTGPQMLVVGRKRGRPVGSTRVTEPRSAVTTWLPASEHDRLVKLAERRGASVSSTVRLLLMTKWQRSGVE